MTTLSPGANAPLKSRNINLQLVLPGGAEIDISALQLTAAGKVRGDQDMCFFNQTSISNGAVSMTSVSRTEVRFDISLDRIDAAIEKIVFTATLEKVGMTFGNLGDIRVQVSTGEVAEIPSAGRTERALILCEVYRHNGNWKLRNVGQGFNGGLKDLAEHFGVEIEAAVPPPPPPPPIKDTTLPVVLREPKNRPTPPDAKPLNLTKISLTKNEKTISLKKESGLFGKIIVNLNWNQKTKKTGLFGLGSSAIDLDVGAFVEDRHGNVTAVQALGDCFGDYQYFPYVKLLGDDRTGAVTDGEFLEINGDMWPEFHRILIYAFIYSGVPNWGETGGVVRVMIPGQPEVEVKMDELGGRDIMCAVAYLENANGAVKVSRELKFFQGHKAMDDAYGFGMSWRAGSK